jgi:hypothetical protein
MTATNLKGDLRFHKSNEKEISHGSVIANMLTLLSDGASLLANAFGISFIDWLDAVLELRLRRGRRLTARSRDYSWCRCITLPGKAFLQFICDSLFHYVLNGIAQRR